MNNTVIIRLRALDRYSSFLTKVVASGVTQINSIAYESNNAEEHYNNALKKAVQQAREKVDIIAATGGRTVGSLLRVSEQGTEYSKSQLMPSTLAKSYDASSSIEVGVNAGVAQNKAVKVAVTA